FTGRIGCLDAVAVRGACDHGAVNVGGDAEARRRDRGVGATRPCLALDDEVRGTPRMVHPCQGEPSRSLESLTPGGEEGADEQQCSSRLQLPTVMAGLVAVRI